MHIFDPRLILSIPIAYSIFRKCVASQRAVDIYVNKTIAVKSRDKILDIGCGPGDILENLPIDVDYTGYDIDENYINKAKAKYGDRGNFICKRVSEISLSDEIGSFDIVLASGLLHHLSDTEAIHLFNLAKTILKPNGRLITLDCCYTPNQNSIARWIISKDRGEYVRNEEGYASLANQVFSDVKKEVHHNLLRIPYTHIIMECTKINASD